MLGNECAITRHRNEKTKNLLNDGLLLPDQMPIVRLLRDPFSLKSIFLVLTVWFPHLIEIEFHHIKTVPKYTSLDYIIMS